MVKAFCGHEGRKATVRDGASFWADNKAHLRERAARSTVDDLAMEVFWPATVKCHGARTPEPVKACCQ